jgi:hypothetical protein
MHSDAEDRQAPTRDDDRAAGRDIDASLKRFIDAVVVPALVARLGGTPRSHDRARARRSDPTAAAPAQR